MTKALGATVLAIRFTVKNRKVGLRWFRFVRAPGLHQIRCAKGLNLFLMSLSRLCCSLGWEESFDYALM